ncbi:25S rRNA (cytosine(2278)-C(5))-methyltransferase [Malassezia cuniculi]|uniref:25S rRNA (Cytosine(2278)-C(5))-methyltransferase n=1 Tax=Malassezia cuniculi TaxID=948313 RepID=A0AAF0EXN6_9BASI|nr:25S rRNA (cytosine(2278)-C(5))-methyltransferase [Malassezia cuniculi]
MADFYVRSARALQDILAHRGSVKAISTYGDGGSARNESAHALSDARRVMALIVNTLAFREALLHIIGAVDLSRREAKWFGRGSPLNKGNTDEPMLCECVLLLLVHDLLFEKRGIQAARAWQPRERVERYKTQLHAALVRLQLQRKCARVEDLRSGEAERAVAERIPRWVRVNTLKISEDEAQAAFSTLGFVLTNEPVLSAQNEYARSTHVPGVYAFHHRASAKLMGSDLYRDGAIVLQDLASCFPAAILGAAETALDATAAPGNKTSHLSALMGGEGTLYAFERAPMRYKTLVRMLGRAGCLAERPHRGNVHPQKQDFLAVDPQEYAGVTHMLLDPSCSGSGIINRLDYLTGSTDDEQDNLEGVVPGEKAEKDRLAALAALQTRMIRRAMEFPGLTRFTYSTCSVHDEENEHVVVAALESDEAVKGGWQLAPREQVLPTWPHRGRGEACTPEMAECMGVQVVHKAKKEGGC